MDLRRLSEALDRLAESVKGVIRASMEDAGVGVSSHIVEDLTSEAVGTDLIRVLIHDYYTYINDGARYTTVPPPVEAIRRWCEETDGVDSDNSTVFAIREAIFKRGLRARPFVDSASSGIDDLYDGFAEEVMEIFSDEVGRIMGK